MICRSTFRIQGFSSPVVVLKWTAYFTCIALCFFRVPSANATPSTPPQSAARTDAQSSIPDALPIQELYKKIGPAVVKVVVRHYEVPIAMGAGFFVGSDGILVTHHSLLRSVLMDPSYTVEFVTFDKRVISNFQFLGCGTRNDELNSGELCLLKMNPDPKGVYSLIPTVALAQETINPGEGANVFGHARRENFLITRGQLRAKAMANKNQFELQLTDSFGPGTTGGPVFDGQGRVFGVAGKFNADNANATDVISSSEIKLLLETQPTATPIAEARKIAQESMHSEIHRKATADLDEALLLAASAKPVTELKDYKDVALKFDDRILHLTLPNIFDDCSLTQTTHDSILHACFALGDTAVLSVQKLPGKGYADLLARNGKTILDSHPVASAEELMQNDEWSLYEPLLTPTQKRSFFSQASAAQCQIVRSSALKEAAFSDIQACRFSVSNDTEPGDYSINVWLLKDRSLYSVTMWMSHPLMAEYFSRISSLAVMTAHWELGAEKLRALASEKKQIPLAAYKVGLLKTLIFKGAKTDSKDAQIDIYGKKLLSGHFAEGYDVAITNQQRPYLAPDFDDVAKRSALEVAKRLNARVRLETVEIETTTIAHRPGRLFSAFGKDANNHDVLILSGAVFFEDQTFEISQIAISDDPSETFKEFKILLSSFEWK